MAEATPTSSDGLILDGDQIPEGISRNFIRLPGEDQSDFYLRVTHLHHQRQRIRQIGDLSLVRNLTVLYLYENRLESIERLESLVHLQMLYLQDNRIRGIQGLMELKKLKKLFLSGNRIKRIENLDTLNALTDLYVDRQKLEPGDNLEFDPITCLALKSLQILNTSHNRMTSLNHLHKCRSLTILDASHNQLGPDPIELGVSLRKMTSLRELDLTGNPVAQRVRHWENLVGECGQLTTLNGKPVHFNTKTMMANLKKIRATIQSS